MAELPKTEAELQALIDQKVEEATTALETKYNGKFAEQRTKYEGDIKKLKESIGKSAEELAEQKIKEQQEADQKELAELRIYKKSKTLEERLIKENLPSYLKNDARLLNASDEDFDKALKEVKKDYETSLPKGNPHSTVVPAGGGKPTATDKERVNQEFAEALKELVGK